MYTSNITRFIYLTALRCYIAWQFNRHPGVPNFNMSESQTFWENNLFVSDGGYLWNEWVSSMQVWLYPWRIDSRPAEVYLTSPKGIIDRV